MADFAGVQAVPPLFIHSMSRYVTEQLGGGLGDTGALSSGAWSTVGANTILYLPLRLPFAYPLKRVFVANGSTANGNWDVALLSPDGGRLCSAGSTAQAGTNALQYASIDMLIPPGAYYLALGLSSATGTVFRSTGLTTNRTRLLGVLQQATFPIPAAATFAAAAQGFWPLFGLTLTSTGF